MKTPLSDRSRPMGTRCPRPSALRARTAAVAAVVPLALALLWHGRALPLTLLLPSEFALRGNYVSSDNLPSGSVEDQAPLPSWSLVAERHGTVLRGTLVVPGHKLLEGARVEVSLRRGALEGVILGHDGEPIGKVWGLWGTDGAEGGFQLVTQEAGQWSWSRTPMLLTSPETEP